MYITYEQIKPYIEKKLVSERNHPIDPNIRIFNYTNHCQFEGAWDEVTMKCRGLIMNVETGEILANPFPKFFNYEEAKTRGIEIPEEVPHIVQKFDGSLGILYWFNGKPCIATRGSFESEQAIWATKWVQENVFKFPMIEEMKRNDFPVTLLFEIIYPQNRIVVNYDFSGLVFLAARHTPTGDEIWPPTLFCPTNIRTPNQISNADYETLRKMDTRNEEGFVLYYPSTCLRLKVKFPEYLRLHKLITGVSEKAIWEILAAGGGGLKELMENVPDEFQQWVKKVEQDLWDRFTNVERLADIPFKWNVRMAKNRAEQAAIIKKFSSHPSVSFAMLDGKDYKKIIWKLVKPKGESVFKKDE